MRRRGGDDEGRFRLAEGIWFGDRTGFARPWLLGECFYEGDLELLLSSISWFFSFFFKFDYVWILLVDASGGGGLREREEIRFKVETYSESIFNNDLWLRIWFSIE